MDPNRREVHYPVRSPCIAPLQGTTRRHCSFGNSAARHLPSLGLDSARDTERQATVFDGAQTSAALVWLPPHFPRESRHIRGGIIWGRRVGSKRANRPLDVVQIGVGVVLGWLSSRAYLRHTSYPGNTIALRLQPRLGLFKLPHGLLTASCFLEATISYVNGQCQNPIMFGFDIEFRRHRWALIYCSISAIGALVFGYDNTYYSGILGMQEFKNDYGDHYEDGAKALATSFTSLTTSSIYIGDMLGALIAGPLNDRFGRKTVLWIASAFVLAGGVTQVADTNIEGVIVLGRILIGLGVGNFTVTSLL